MNKVTVIYSKEGNGKTVWVEKRRVYAGHFNGKQKVETHYTCGVDYAGEPELNFSVRRENITAAKRFVKTWKALTV